MASVQIHGEHVDGGQRAFVGVEDWFDVDAFAGGESGAAVKDPTVGVEDDGWRRPFSWMSKASAASSSSPRSGRSAVVGWMSMVLSCRWFGLVEVR